MPSLKAIKKRITSVRSTQKITRAMKLVSAAKLRRATERAHSSRPYEEELRQIIGSILQDVEWSSELIQARKTIKKTAYVVISTDRGLAGSLNANLFKFVLQSVLEEGGKDRIEIVALGKKANDFFKKRGFQIHSLYSDLARNSSHEKIAAISKKLRALYLDGTFDRIVVFYPRFQSALIQKPTKFDLLPLVPEKTTEKKSFLLEPVGPQLLEHLVPMYIDFQLFRFVLEGIASEHGARMSAMESATKNAKDMIDRLTLQRNRARQAAITKELMEIIGGAEALAG